MEQFPNIEMSLIYARSINGYIGNNCEIPWVSTKDMKHFKDTTYGHIVVMGSKTFGSLPDQKPLKNRFNIVMTRGNKDYNCDLVINSKQQLYDWVQQNKDKYPLYYDNCYSHIFIIGGKQIYDLFIEDCDSIYESIIQDEYPGDTKAPIIPFNFKLQYQRSIDDRTLSVTFRKYIKDEFYKKFL